MLKFGTGSRSLNFGIRPMAHRASTRYFSTALHFYQNRQLELYASKEAKRLTLRQLVFFGRSMSEERLIKSANYVRTELPVRIAHRLRDLQRLPYIVVTQEGVAKVYELYWSAFEKFRQYPPITTLAENEKFCEFLHTLLHEHSPVIPNLSLGLSLSSPYLSPDDLDAFMRRMLVSRISRRVLAEHHIALSENFAGRGQETSGEPHVGIIFTGLNIKRSVEHCAKLLAEGPLSMAHSSGRCPNVLVDGHTDTAFAYIREHLEYIIFELLKNVGFIINRTTALPNPLLKSMHATSLKHKDAVTLPPVQVTIVAGDHDVGIRISDQGGGLRDEYNRPVRASDIFSFSHVRNAGRLDDSRLGALRNASKSDQGVRGTVGEQVGRWQKANGDDGDDLSINPVEVLHPRIGIGLPMSYIFATYFGGTLDLVSLDGWGTDVYLRLPKLGTNLEGIEV